MAIKKLADLSDDTKFTVEIDNGHFEALKKATADYEIKDIESALGFIIAVLSAGEGKPIRIGTNTFVPVKGIKKDPDLGSSAKSTANE